MRVRAAMPGELWPRRRGWQVAAWPLAILALYISIHVPFAARLPNGDGPQLYPTFEVMLLLSVVFAEAVCMIGWLCARREQLPLGGRAFLLSAALVVVGFMFVPFVADHVISALLGWHFLAAIWLFAVALAHGLVGGARPAFRRSQRDDLSNTDIESVR